MPRVPRIEYENAIYHVMNRGKGRQVIFHGAAYYEEFLETLAEAHERFAALIHGYCLMPNHYHLLIETPDANLSRIMRHINGVYTQRHNHIMKTDGPLFRGRYKAILVDEESYLLQLSRYIHRNPIEIKRPMVDDLKNWLWSSYPAYVNHVDAPDWLCREKIYGMLTQGEKELAYRDFVAEGSDLNIQNFYNKGKISAILGSSEFKATIIQREQLSEKEVCKRGIIRPGADMIIDVVAATFSISPQEITKKSLGRPQGNLAKKLAIYCCQHLGGMTLKEIAQHFNLASAGSVAGCLGEVKKKLLNHDVWQMYLLIKENLYSMKYT